MRAGQLKVICADLSLAGLIEFSLLFFSLSKIALINKMMGKSIINVFIITRFLIDFFLLLLWVTHVASVPARSPALTAGNDL